MNLVEILKNIGCENARTDGIGKISSLRDGRWVKMFAEMGYDKGELIFPDGGHSSFFLVLPDGNIASANNAMCANGFYAVAEELGIDATDILETSPYGEVIMYKDKNGLEDDGTSISIWTPKEFQMKLQKCKQLVNKIVNESKSMSKKNTIRLTESELKSLITESVRKIIMESSPIGGFQDYQGADMDYSRVYEDAIDVIIRYQKEGKQLNSVRDVIKALGFVENSFNEEDWETVYDACQDAYMWEVYQKYEFGSYGHKNGLYGK